ncbi:MAG: peptidase S7 [Dehalobacterium sp.]
MQIKGIAREIVDKLVNRTLELGQGRNAGCIGFIDQDGVISSITPLVNGGLSGVPLRMLLNEIISMRNRSLLEGITYLPSNAVFIMSRPGKTGLITDVSAVDFFNLPVVSIGVKETKGLTGVGAVTPKPKFFDLATKSELIDIKTLSASSMEEEREVLRQGTELSLEYLDVSEEIAIVDVAGKEVAEGSVQGEGIHFSRKQVHSIDKTLAEELVRKSLEAGSGREVAVIGTVDEKGHVTAAGHVVVGGMGYIPSRMLASSAVEIKGRSLKDIYSSLVPMEGIFVHTHPGGTGVMHIGDANAGPGSWNRPIIAIGHDSEGKVKGATVIEVSEKLYDLADEDEQLSQAFFTADDPEEEASIRNRKFGIAQEYTALCKTIEIQ